MALASAADRIAAPVDTPPAMTTTVILYPPAIYITEVGIVLFTGLARLSKLVHLYFFLKIFLTTHFTMH